MWERHADEGMRTEMPMGIRMGMRTKDEDEGKKEEVEYTGNALPINFQHVLAFSVSFHPSCPVDLSHPQRISSSAPQPYLHSNPLQTSPLSSSFSHPSSITIVHLSPFSASNLHPFCPLFHGLSLFSASIRFLLSIDL